MLVTKNIVNVPRPGRVENVELTAGRQVGLGLRADGCWAGIVAGLWVMDAWMDGWMDVGRSGWLGGWGRGRVDG